MNLAARAGRWSAAHWKTATFGWLAFVVAAVALGTIVGTKQLTDAQSSNGQTAKAEQILAGAGFDKSVTESVLVQAKQTYSLQSTQTILTSTQDTRIDGERISMG